MMAWGGQRLQAGRVGDDVAPGARTFGAVRPEHVMLAAEEPTGAVNRLSVQVAATVMLGDVLEHILALPDGSDLLCRRPRAQGAATPPSGTVWAHWPPDALSLLPHEDLGRASPRLRGRGGDA